MNRKELIQYVREQTGYGAKAAQDTVNATLDGIARALEDGDRVSLPGFGTFSVKERAPKTGRNPQTGAAVDIPARRAITFKPAKTLKDNLNGTDVSESA